MNFSFSASAAAVNYSANTVAVVSKSSVVRMYNGNQKLCYAISSMPIYAFLSFLRSEIIEVILTVIIALTY